MSEKIVPHGDFVVVEILSQEKTKGGLIIPDKARTGQRDAIVNTAHWQHAHGAAGAVYKFHFRRQHLL